ncbi:hypothetical protein EDEG_03383 [Edhazardia aedis USNM 41457]|uniref:Uncharacterized protein n=1 Tax=Edhazardia aedis (strain USNM 41457) TaxID=1003232 RepID=J9DLF2_EDHAE|nr:hypothetical protein EDEG_03383 [Edhazardia aedis USNM 41457]|eukprot:EJW02187.1 hypothetical protein EDEG_03383 [Edhazardia aedis USNM 41457]
MIVEILKIERDAHPSKRKNNLTYKQLQHEVYVLQKEMDEADKMKHGWITCSLKNLCVCITKKIKRRECEVKRTKLTEELTKLKIKISESKEKTSTIFKELIFAFNEYFKIIKQF